MFRTSVTACVPEAIASHYLVRDVLRKGNGVRLMFKPDSSALVNRDCQYII